MDSTSLADFMQLSSQAVSTTQILMSFSVVTLLGIWLYYFYSFNYIGVLYSRSFNLSLLLISFLVCIIMMIIGSNLALSLGMVGALSIIRYRTAIKEPLDTGFLFWSIANGLACGAGSFKIVLIGNAFLSIILFLFLNIKRIKNTYLLSIQGSDLNLEALSAKIQESSDKSKLKLHTSYEKSQEYIFELQVQDSKIQTLISAVKSLGVEQVNLTTFDNESPV